MEKEKNEMNGAMNRFRQGASAAVAAAQKGASTAGQKLKEAATSENTQQALQKARNFYIVDLMVRLVKGKNISALIYLGINVALIMGVFYMFTQSVGGMFLGLLLYVVCVCAALSPLGEFILRHNYGCKELTDPQIAGRLEPLFREVYDRAVSQQTGYNIHPKIKLYISDDPSINAFATGRRTVCVTSGLLQLPDDQIKGVLGHEMGHLANHDTDLIMLITVGNFLVSAFVTFVKICITLGQLLFNFICLFIGGSEGFLANLLGNLSSMMTLLFVNLITWIWSKLGVLLVMKSSRSQEFAADRFTCELGYAQPMLAFFHSINTPAPKKEKISLLDRLKGETGIFAVLTSSHPATQKRIEAIENHLRLTQGQ